MGRGSCPFIERLGCYCKRCYYYTKCQCNRLQTENKHRGTLSLSSFTLTLNGNGGLGGNLEIYGTLNGNSGIIQLTGDFTLSGTFNYATSTVVFNGNDAQRMLGNAPTFYHLRSTNTNNTVGKGVSLHQTNTTIKGNFIADGVFSRNSQSFPNATVTFDGVDTQKGSYSFFFESCCYKIGSLAEGGYKTVYYRKLDF
jgi:hypothetical protein